MQKLNCTWQHVKGLHTPRTTAWLKIIYPPRTADRKLGTSNRDSFMRSMGKSNVWTILTSISCMERLAFSSFTKLIAFLTTLPSSLMCSWRSGKLLSMKFCKSWTNWGFRLFKRSLIIRQLSQRDSSIFKEPGEPLRHKKEVKFWNFKKKKQMPHCRQWNIPKKHDVCA